MASAQHLDHYVFALLSDKVNTLSILLHLKGHLLLLHQNHKQHVVVEIGLTSRPWCSYDV